MSAEDDNVEIVKVLYDYDAEDETCLTLRTGDIIYVINKDDSGWYDGVLSSGPLKGKRAWFPSNFTKPIEDAKAQSPPTNEIPVGWKRKESSDGTSYYYNLNTYQTVNSKEEIPKNPRQSMLLLKANSVDFEELKDLVHNKEDARNNANTSVPTWEYLLNEIFKSISELNNAAKIEDKSKFLVCTSLVIKSVYLLLLGCDCVSKNAIVLKQNSQLRNNHILLLSNTAKLVLCAKKASGIYPRPKSTTKMRYQAGQVLLSVRHFVASAQQLPLQPINALDVDMELPPVVSDYELVKKLDIFANNVLTSTTEMISLLQDSSTLNIAISASKSIVYEVGQIFSLVDELKLGSIRNKEVNSLVDDFKMKREQLYERVNDLVMKTCVLLDSFAPTDSTQSLSKCCSLLMRATEELINATKILIDKKEDYEQVILEQEIKDISDPKRDSDLMLLQKRAMSLTLSLTPQTLSRCTSQELSEKVALLRASASKLEFNKDHDSAAATDKSNDSLETLKIINHKSSLRTSKAYLTYDYDPKELILNIDGLVSGGTLLALVERLTLHDMTIDPQYLTSFLQTFRLFTNQLEFLKLLKQRFMIQQPLNVSPDDVVLWKERKLTPIRLRVFNVLKTWIELYFYSEDQDYFVDIEEFATSVIKPFLPSMALRLLDTLKKQKELELSQILTTPELHKSRSNKSLKMMKNTSIVQLDYTDVAKQITVLETEMFLNLQPEDLINYVFRSKNKKVSEMTKFSTNVI